MHELKVVGVESGKLLLTDDDGARYRVTVDEVLHARLRQASPEVTTARKLAPKEIQAQIRAGMSAEDVAAVTGASIEDIRRFEGPVLAEREFVIQSALAVPVRGADADPLLPAASFGEIIRGRLVDAGALGERWASWKEQGGGWVVKLTFTANQVEHDARWGYDPKRGALTPLNPEAETLSQQGDMPAPLIPRLRAVPAEEAPAGEARFDSGAFTVSEEPGYTSPLLEPVPYGRTGRPAPKQADAAPERGARAESAGKGGAANETADLLEALRRRRGERDPLDPEHEEALAQHPSTGTVRLVDVPIDTTALDVPVPAPREAAPRERTPRAPSAGAAPARPARKGRATMPSWDDIVFGARPDED